MTPDDAEAPSRSAVHSGRREDGRFLRGTARYLADQLESTETTMVHVIRSEIAHGRLRSVEAIGSLGDCELLGPETFEGFPGIVPIVWSLGDQTQHSSAMFDRDIRYVGQPIALLIGPDAASLADAASTCGISDDAFAAIQAHHEERKANRAERREKRNTAIFEEFDL